MRSNNNLRHTIPQLNVPDYILSAGGIDVSVRQFLITVVAVLIDINLYIELEPFLADMSAIVWGLLAIPIILALIFSWVKVQGQPLEVRLLRMMRYYGRPQIYVWQRATASTDPEILTEEIEETKDTQKAV